jgi:predicted Zn-dependent protease
MPKRDVAVISHSVLTNHRIVAEAEERFPEAAFNMTTPQLPDLVHLSANPTKPGAVAPLTRLQAYAQIILAHPEYRNSYWSLAQQLRAAEADNVYVLEALADEAGQKHDAEGALLAIRYLQAAVAHGSTNPADFEELAQLLAAADRPSEAIDVLREGMQVAPSDAVLYQLSTTISFAQNKPQEACEVAAKGTRTFPQDDALRSFLKRCDARGEPKK